MKTISALLLSVVVLAAVVISFDTVGALPTGLGLQIEEDQVQLTDLEPINEHVDDNGGDDNAGIRQARVTCDLLSFKSKWLSPNHSACAARCIAQRKKGGSCKNGVCRCRK